MEASAAPDRSVSCCRDCGGDDERAEDRDCEDPDGGDPIVENPVGDYGERRYAANEPDIAKE